MPLSSQHKIGLLCDILQNQADEKYMTDDEATQINRLLQSLTNDPSVSSDMKHTLTEITQHHVINHQPFEQKDVEKWLNVINHPSIDSNSTDSPGNTYS
ncbi:YtzH-like family protein [Bacillus sp. FJAT-45037]|uniref:YtzH-like family protein n=1 Tax=Bacillus sp. FJAT-45037 TaxID=2011007 RepID=UPI000C2352ED|nr:YtzH-like family protein [Bacillus sp. FJAT-45037]